MSEITVNGKRVEAVSAAGSISKGARLVLPDGERVPDDAPVIISAGALAELLIKYCQAGADGVFAQQAPARAVLLGEEVGRQVAALAGATVAAAAISGAELQRRRR